MLPWGYFNTAKYFEDAAKFPVAGRLFRQTLCEYSCADFASWVGTSNGEKSGTGMFTGELLHPKVASWKVNADTGLVTPSNDCTSAARKPTGNYAVNGYYRLHASAIYAEFVKK